MKPLTTALIITCFALTGCASLVENDIFTKQKPDPNAKYEDANKAEELTRCVRDKKRDAEDPDCYLKNR